MHTNNPIVVGIDGSSSAIRAARWAATEAQRRGLPLRLVHAYEIPTATRRELSTRPRCAPASRSWAASM